jgi:hypothetical protein
MEEAHMRLYRYELYCDDGPQNVGFIVGLHDLLSGPNPILTDMQAEMLLEPLDDELLFPHPNRKDIVCLFTEFGQMYFKNAINNIIEAYEDSLFVVKEIIVEIPDDERGKLAYEDDWQACLEISLYKRLAAEYEWKERFAA